MADEPPRPTAHPNARPVSLLAHFPLESGNDTVLAAMGTALFGNHDTTAALLVFERAAAQPSNVEILTSLGMLYRAADRPADAAAVLRRATLMDPSRGYILLFLGDMLIASRHADQAVVTLEELVKREPDAARALAILSLAYADVGRSSDAFKSAQRAVQHEGQDARVYLYAGRAMLDNHQPAVAIDYLTHAVTIDPQDSEAVAALHRARAALGKRLR